MELAAVYEDASAQDAQIFPWAIDFCPAATIECQGAYGIFIDFSLCSNMADYKWKLAHEVSHCATGCTHKVSSPFDLVQKHEFTANRRAIETYLPYPELLQAMRAGYTEPWQLAEYFSVPEYAITKALHYWSECRGKSFSA